MSGCNTCKQRARGDWSSQIYTCWPWKGNLLSRDDKDSLDGLQKIMYTCRVLKRLKHQTKVMSSNTHRRRTKGWKVALKIALLKRIHENVYALCPLLWFRGMLPVGSYSFRSVPATYSACIFYQDIFEKSTLDRYLNIPSGLMNNTTIVGMMVLITIET